MKFVLLDCFMLESHGVSGAYMGPAQKLSSIGKHWVPLMGRQLVQWLQQAGMPACSEGCLAPLCGVEAHEAVR